MERLLKDFGYPFYGAHAFHKNGVWRHNFFNFGETLRFDECRVTFSKQR
jgi:hypothetical protein